MNEFDQIPEEPVAAPEPVEAVPAPEPVEAAPAPETPAFKSEPVAAVPEFKPAPAPEYPSPPAFEEAPPQYQQTPPQYDQTPPQYGQAPQYGQTPPPYGQAPQYGQMPPQYTQQAYAQKPADTSLRTVAFVINIICMIIIAVNTFGIGLAWCIPMTIYSYKIIKSPYKHTTFGVCCLLFLGIISGILILCSGGTEKPRY